MTASEEEDGDVPIRAIADGSHGYDGSSWWPLLTAVGAFSFMVGVGTYIVGSNTQALVNPMLGIAVSLVGLLVAVSGISGWVYEAFIAQYWERRTDGNRDRYLWGMLLYFPVEFAVIGAGLLYFAIIYFEAWPPGQLPPMFVPMIWIMTGILFVSTFTNYFASRAIKNGNRRKFLFHLAATPILGVLFLAGKAWNWNRLIFQEGYTIASGTYWTAFFSVSGFHGLLVLTGIAFMLVVLARALAGHYSPEEHVSVTTSTMYWWIVDSIWLIIVVEIYGTAFLCRSAGNC